MFLFPHASQSVGKDIAVSAHRYNTIHAVNYCSRVRLNNKPQFFLLSIEQALQFPHFISYSKNLRNRWRSMGIAFFTGVLEFVRMNQISGEYFLREIKDSGANLFDKLHTHRNCLAGLGALFCLVLLSALLFIQKSKRTLTKANFNLKIAYHEIEEKQSELLKQNIEFKNRQEEIMIIINKLEELVEERTLKLKGRTDQLNAFAFFNAHKLRSPITTILGLYGLLKFCQSEQERLEVLEWIKKPIEELERLSQISQRLLDENYKYSNDQDEADNGNI